MTREEMIKRVCEDYVKEKTTYFSLLSFSDQCAKCNAHELNADGFLKHEPNCIAGYAQRLLTTPVIEPGDVVMNNKTGCEFEVVKIIDSSKVLIYETYYGNSFLQNKFHYMDELTLTRKGSHVSND